MPEPVQAAVKPSRTLGITALVIALVPVVATLIVGVYPALFPAPADSFGWLFLVAAMLTVVTPLCGIAALVLGIIAARRDRGRAAGIAGAVIGGVVLLYSMFGLVVYGLAAVSNPY